MMLYKIYTLLFLIFCFHLVNNVIIIQEDNLPFIYDQRGYYHKSVAIFNSIKDSISLKSFEPIWLTIKDITIYPPLRHLSTLVLYGLLGVSPKIALYSNLFYLLILLIFVYKISSDLFNEDVGILASFIISFLPEIFGFSRLYMLDFSVLALLPLGIFLIYRSKFFTLKYYSFLTGIIIAIGYLHKQTYLIFILPILIYAIFLGQFRYRKKIKIMFYNLILTGIGFLPALVWSVVNFDAQRFLSKVSFSFTSNLTLEAFKNIIWGNFYRIQLYPVITALFCISTLLFIYREKKHRFLFIYIVLILGYQIFFLPEDLPRHNMPVLIMVGIIIARVLERGLYFYRIFKIRDSIIVLFIFFLICQFFYLCYFRKEHIPKNKILDYLERRFQYTGLVQAHKFYFPVEKLIKIISNKTQHKREVMVLIVKEEPISELLYFKMNEKRIKYHFVPIYRLGKLVFSSQGEVSKVVPKIENIDILLLPFKVDILKEKECKIPIDLPEIHRQLFFEAFALYLARSLRVKGESELNPLCLSVDRLEKLFNQFFTAFLEKVRKYSLVAEVDLDPDIFTEFHKFYIYKR